MKKTVGFYKSFWMHLVHLFLILLVACAGYWLGDEYSARLSNHRGYFLVEGPVHDVPAMKRRPRRVVVVVIDGLRRDAAQGMESLRRLSSVGHCFSTDVGPLTMSRPVYALISTGLEVHRTGVRSNDDETAISIESIWQVARRKGLRVHGASGLDWWRQLFPQGFDDYLIDPEGNLFDQVEVTDVTLIHPLQVDDAGHAHGADSDSYRSAVERIDGELSDFLPGMDFERDLIVVTADHGHVPAGGHGGTSSDIARVWTCFAGPGVHEDSDLQLTDSRVIAAAISVLMGLPFPRHMRAGDDSLDDIWRFLDGQALGDEYVMARRRQIDDFRSINRKRVAVWSGDEDGSWNDFYAQQRNRHRRNASVAGAVLLLLVLSTVALRYRSGPRITKVMVWMLAVVVCGATLYVAIRGTFDLSSINLRSVFIRNSLATIGSAAAAGAGLHFYLWRDLRALSFDFLTLALAVLCAVLAHRWIYGAPMGFPLPGRHLLFFPYIGSAYILSYSGLSLVTAVLARRYSTGAELSP